MNRILINLLFSLFFLAGKVQADCLEQAGRTYGVSPLLLEAIAQVESSDNPLSVGALVSSVRARLVYDQLVNLSVPFTVRPYGRRYLFSISPESKGQAERVLKVVSTYADTYDVGLMQINKLWIEKYSLKPEWLLDRCYNLKWGAYVLSRMVAKYGYTWNAVWHYNGRKDYAEKVINSLKRLCRQKYRQVSYCRRLLADD